MDIQPDWISKSGVYCIENLKNGKRYIGSSINIHTRLQKHRSLLRGNRHDNRKLQNSWNKHSEDKFTCYILVFAEPKDLITTEQQQMDLFNPWYNCMPAQCITRSLESRSLQAETRKKLFAIGALVANCSKEISYYNYNGKRLGTFSSKKKLSIALKIELNTIHSMLKNPACVPERSPYMIYYGNAKRVQSFWSQFPYYKVSKKNVIIKVAHLHHLKLLYGFKHGIVQYLRNRVGMKSSYKTKYLLDLVKPGELLETPVVKQDNQQPS